MAYDYDLFVIGAGSGGVRAARLAAMTGARVGVAEEYRVGGTCVIRGCVPKKLMVYASNFAREFEFAKGYGWSFGQAPVFDWPSFLAAKDMEIARLSGIYTANLAKAGADVFETRASFLDPHTLQLDGVDKPLTAERVLIATGGRPRLPDDVPGAEMAITSEGAFQLEQLPKSILIVGGGYIAVEFACIFHGLGVDVTLAYRGSNLLRGFDEDVRSHVAGELRKRGLKVALACQHERIERIEGGFRSHLTDSLICESEQVMFAVGREPHVKGLGLEAAGVELNAAGAVAVDDFSQTNVPPHLRGRRRHRPDEPDAGGYSGGPGLRRDGLLQPPHQVRPRRRADRGLLPAAGGRGRADGSGGAPQARPRRRLSYRVPRHEDRLCRRRRADPDEARGLPPQRQGDGRPHRGAGCAGDDPARRCRCEGGADQGPVGRHLRAASLRRRGAGDDCARSTRQAN